MEGNKNYTIISDGIKNLYYEDGSCKITLVVADFRDSSWWIGMNNILNKESGILERLSNERKYELYRRVSADTKEELYTDEFGFIKEDIENIDFSKNILDI